MKKRLSNLLCIKSIITIVLLVLFFILSIKGTILPDAVTEIFKMVIVFYFGTQAGKKSSETDKGV